MPLIHAAFSLSAYGLTYPPYWRQLHGNFMILIKTPYAISHFLAQLCNAAETVLIPLWPDTFRARSLLANYKSNILTGFCFDGSNGSTVIVMLLYLIVVRLLGNLLIITSRKERKGRQKYNSFASLCKDKILLKAINSFKFSFAKPYIFFLRKTKTNKNYFKKTLHPQLATFHIDLNYTAF